MKSARDAGLLKRNFKISMHSGSKIAMSIDNTSEEISVSSQMAHHGFVRHLVLALASMLKGEFTGLEDLTWEQSNAHKNICCLVELGQLGYDICRLKLYTLAVKQIGANTPLQSSDLKTSRVLNEVVGKYKSGQGLSSHEKRYLAADDDLAPLVCGGGAVRIFDQEILAEDLDEACVELYDNDSKGVASKETVRTSEGLRWNGIKLKSGHGKKVGHCTTQFTFRRGFTRMRLRCADGVLYSSRAFSLRDFGKVITNIREVNAALGKVVWQDTDTDSDWTAVNNSMFNLLLSGAGGKNVGFWVLGLIRSGDLGMSEHSTQACYVRNHSTVLSGGYTATSALSGDVFRMLHTYTDGTDLWVDFDDNNILERVTIVNGRIAHAEVAGSTPAHLRECMVAGTVRLKDTSLTPRELRERYLVENRI